MKTGSPCQPNHVAPAGIPHSHDGFFRVDIRAQGAICAPKPGFASTSINKLLLTITAAYPNRPHNPHGSSYHSI